MDAPKQVGRYDAFFRMATPDDKLFGHKVWCDIMTIEPEKKPEVQQVVVPVEPGPKIPPELPLILPVL